MHAPSKALFPLAALALPVLSAACGDSDNSSRDAAVDLRPPTSDSYLFVDLPIDHPSGPDSAAPRLDAAVLDTPVTIDTARVDGTASARDASPTELDAPPQDVAYDRHGNEAFSALDGPPAATDSGHPDARLDAAPDGFAPAPATPIVVNSGNTGQYNLSDGTWSVFYFDAVAGQLYCLSGLSGIVRGYVSTSPMVSPANYQHASDANGNLAFTATAAQRHYIAVAATGGGTSGSFQVADGGQLLALGANTVVLPAPDLDNYHFFRFPITQGRAYSVSITGTATDSVGLGLSPKAERASNGQFSYPLRGISGPLPFTNEAIPTTSVSESYSGHYFLFLRVYSATSITVTITQAS